MNQNLAVRLPGLAQHLGFGELAAFSAEVSRHVVSQLIDVTSL
jgi:hypothetical protein